MMAKWTESEGEIKRIAEEMERVAKMASIWKDFIVLPQMSYFQDG